MHRRGTFFGVSFLRGGVLWKEEGYLQIIPCKQTRGEKLENK